MPSRGGGRRGGGRSRGGGCRSTPTEQGESTPIPQEEKVVLTAEEDDDDNDHESLGEDTPPSQGKKELDPDGLWFDDSRVARSITGIKQYFQQPWRNYSMVDNATKDKWFNVFKIRLKKSLKAKKNRAGGDLSKPVPPLIVRDLCHQRCVHVNWPPKVEEGYLDTHAQDEAGKGKVVVSD